MNKDDLFLALGEVDDAYLLPSLESARKHQKQKTWRRIIAAAACLALIITGGVRGYGMVREQSTVSVVYPEQSLTFGTMASLNCISQVIYYDYEALSAVSDIVVVADVVENQCEYYQSNCFRLYAKIAVNDALKGTVEKGETLFVGENGYAYRNEAGERGDTYTSCGGPLLEKGNRVLLFLVEPEVQEGSYFTTANGEGLWTFYAMPIGKFFYDKDGKYHASATYAKDYTDTYCNYSMLTDYTPKTLDEIKALIQ